MNKINENRLAKQITLLEGKAINLSIGQVKEVIKLLRLEFKTEYLPSEVMEWIERK